MSKRIRCAIYTRKSTEEGLEQNFNSLDAQREACEAFVQSQRGQGWIVRRKRYDDGGISGGNMDRPALQELLADIEKGKIDLVVVYKVDRLTRSLMDFAKIIETFDAGGVSFVSVTQQFNSANSMGRLTLNVLLSFAQFEREVTAERIRDKIAASKKKGMWMGGLPPLGYDNVEKKLVINEREAEKVRYLYDRYLELGSIRDLKACADRKGIITKRRRSGGGSKFTRGHLAQLLRNPIYAGRIAHRGKTYEGQHKAIIDQESWNQVQQCLDRKAPQRRSPKNQKHLSLLAGLFFDETGDRMTPSHTNKKGVRYRYYVSQRLIGDPGAKDGWRVPAEKLENVVLDGLNDVLNSIAAETERLRDRDAHVIWTVLEKVSIEPGRLKIELSREGLNEMMGQVGRLNDHDLVRELPLEIRRRGVESKIVIPGKERSREPDAELIKVIKNAHRWFARLTRDEAATVREIANAEGIDEGDVSRYLRFAFLAPDIVEAILRGDQPLELTAEQLKRLPRVPHSWSEQRNALGFSRKSV